MIFIAGVGVCVCEGNTISAVALKKILVLVPNALEQMPIYTYHYRYRMHGKIIICELNYRNYF